jgi:etoposide-induced 2.4 mRNA
VLPLFWISKPLNAFWFQDIANEAFKRKVSQQEEKSLKSKLEKSTQSSAVYVVADILFSLVMDMLFMLQSAVVGFIPVIGYPLSLVHQVLLISLYAFEYRCYSEGLANCKYRIHIVEGNLVYFLGFGAPLAAVMLYPSSYIVSQCLRGKAHRLPLLGTKIYLQVSRL